MGDHSRVFALCNTFQDGETSKGKFLRKVEKIWGKVKQIKFAEGTKALE